MTKCISGFPYIYAWSPYVIPALPSYGCRHCCIPGDQTVTASPDLFSGSAACRHRETIQGRGSMSVGEDKRGIRKYNIIFLTLWAADHEIILKVKQYTCMFDEVIGQRVLMHEINNT